MGTTRNDIKNWLEACDTETVSHVLIACDTFDHSDYPVEVKKDEDLQKKIREYQSQSMQKIMEVYDLSMDIEKQIDEDRSWNDNEYEPPMKTMVIVPNDEDKVMRTKVPAFDEFGRPCKDLYFMNLAFEVSWRSIDPNTKHGCVAIDKNGGVITTGYNGPPQGCDDTKIPLTSPEKYRFLEHSERNVVEISGGSGKVLEGSTFYVTGLPCYECLRAIMGARASRIVYGPLNSIMCMEDGYFDDYEIFLSGHPLVVERFQYDEELFAKNEYARKAVDNKPAVNITKEFNLRNLYG